MKKSKLVSFEADPVLLGEIVDGYESQKYELVSVTVTQPETDDTWARLLLHFRQT